MTIRILTTLYNSEKYIPKTIQSLKEQVVEDWKCYITADIPTDNSIAVAREAIDGDDRFEIIENEKKMWQTGNYWQVSQKEEIKDEDISMTLDGDDWLPDKRVLERVHSYYEDGKTLITYGQFIYYRGPQSFDIGFASPPRGGIRAQRTFNAFTTTHLRTWKTHLYRGIKKEDMMESETEFYPMAGDLFFMWPMLEMAGEDRAKWIQDINYVYNVETELNEYKVDMNKSNVCANIARTKPAYAELPK